MRMSIDAEGHHLDVDLAISKSGTFTGDVHSKDWGEGSITDGTVSGNTMIGTLHLAGHTATLHAILDGTKVAGSISAFFITKRFTGAIVAI